MNDRETHEEDDPKDNPEDTNLDDDPTSADTPEGDEPKDGAAKAKADQKNAWLKKIKSGDAKLDDMPENLGWLKKEISEELKPQEPEKPKDNDIDSSVERILTEREAKKDFNSLVDFLEDSDISEEQNVRLQQEYEDYLDGVKSPSASQRYKALLIACRLVGIKDVNEALKERRVKGMVLPPLGRKRDTAIQKEKETEMEKKFNRDLPPGFAPPKK